MGQYPSQNVESQVEKILQHDMESGFVSVFIGIIEHAEGFKPGPMAPFCGMLF